MRYSYYLMFFIVWLMTNCSPDRTTSNTMNYYTEKYRPQYHFTPIKNWMNDPNGMVYYEGEYHLFYQHYPDSNVWGPMHWGHAISKDLVNWEHLPIALYPDGNGLIFSGSAVVDYQNTSGLGSVQNPAMVAIFTQHLMGGEKGGRHDFQTQGIAYSNDRGRNWKMYQQNPVLKNPGKHDFRDPKVFWNETSNQWVMILAVKDHVELYGSPDLKSWSHLSDFGYNIGAHGGVWECPDLFEMEIKGTKEKKWVMLVSLNPGAINGGSGTQYFVGQFDGNSFKNDSSDTLWLDYGKDNYAGVTWNNIPDSDGRKLFMGWMSNWQYANIVPTEVWRSSTTIARTLELVNTDGGLRVASHPVKELQTLRGNPIVSNDVIGLNKIESNEIKLSDSTLEMEFIVERTNVTDSFELYFYNTKSESLKIGLEAASNQFYIDRTHAGVVFSKDFDGKHFGKRSTNAKKLNLRIFIDTSSLELFADDGTLVMSELLFPSEPFTLLKVRSKKGVSIKSMVIYPLKSIWKSQPSGV